MEKKFRILMVEDAAHDAALVQHTLQESGLNFSLKRVDTKEAFLRQLTSFHPSVILSDHGLPTFDGFTALALARKKAPNVPFIFVTSSLGDQMRDKAMRSGAADHVLKQKLETLPAAVRRALQQSDLPTWRRQAEKALFSTEAGCRGLVELSPDALFVQVDDRVAFVNSAGVRLFGAARPEELLGRPVRELIDPQHWKKFQQRLARARGAERPIPFVEQRIQRLDGKTVNVEIAVVPLSLAGGCAVEVIVHDTTERREAEEQIKRLNVDLEKRVVERTAELEAANEELEAFSYSVSHDLRAPLRHIEGFVEILTATKSAQLDEESQHYLTTIADSARQMNRLIDDVLAFSRTARAELNKADIRLEGLVQDAILSLQRETENRNVEWVVGDLPVVKADPALLRQVMLNLLGNALKYTRTRETARIEIGSRSEGGEHIVSVRDNGVGFDTRYAYKLFTVFQRLHRAQEFEGTGVGLAIVRRIIHRHGGRTWASSEQGASATFFFSLPINPVEAATG